jgi:quercetin dioxygenase-like cupin family protein
MQAVALLYFALAVAFLGLAGFVILPNLGSAFATEPLRITLVPLVFAAIVAGGVLAWRWRNRGVAARRWFALSLPAVGFLLVAGLPLSKDVLFARQSNLLYFLIGAGAVTAAAAAALAAIAAGLEANSGAARIRGINLETPRGAAQVAAVALVAILVLSGIFWVSSARSSSTQSGQRRASATGPQSGPNAVGFTNPQVAQGTIPALPDGTLYASVAVGTLAAGSAADDRAGPGIVFVASGNLSISMGAAVQNLQPGQAIFVPPNTPVHESNTGSTGGTWYFLSFRRTADKTSATGASHDVCQTSDLPSLPPSNQAETLFAATVKTGGRSQATKTGGVEVLVGIDGTVEVHAGTLSTPMKIAAGQCVVLLENTGVQVVSASGSASRYLAFYLAPSGAPPATNALNPP